MPLTPTVEIAVVAGGVLIVVMALLLLQRRAAKRWAEIAAEREAGQGTLMLQQQIEGLREQLDRALASTAQSVNQQLAQVGDAVGKRLFENARLLQETQRALGERLDSTAQAVGAVHRSLGTLEEANRRIFEIGKDLSSLQQILQAPKLRGGLGELLLEDLLAQILPADHYATQHTFRSGHKVDAVIRLGAGLVPVDAKFPLENFRRILEATGDTERRSARRAFAGDVKRHIDSVAAKYILPDEATFDFALMYIPAENVYYEIIVKDDVTDEAAIGEYALSRRVIPVSPGSFYAYLQAIVLGLRGLRIEERAQEIMAELGRLRGDFERFREDFRVAGRHLSNAANSFAGAERRLERLDAHLAGLEEDGEPVAVDEPKSAAGGGS
ncbi:MAG: DNA recombination protein RmuC [Deltaproteobacteria bacterium]|nr:DNA recombination protein RmuC [Deltaproteobacteria bacterium]